MKYICLGFIDEGMWVGMSDARRNEFIDQCFAYDDILRRNGHFAGGEALEGPRTAVTIRGQSSKPIVTDGPYIETKEYLGGIMILLARDLNHAIQLMSNHPSTLMGGTWEIRPAADLTAMVVESEQRRSTSHNRETAGQA